MLDKATAESEFVFVRRSALQVKTGTNRIGGAIAAVTARIIIPVGSTLVEITALVDCYIRFGTSSVNATSTIGDDDTASRLCTMRLIWPKHSMSPKR